MHSPTTSDVVLMVRKAASWFSSSTAGIPIIAHICARTSSVWAA